MKNLLTILLTLAFSATAFAAPVASVTHEKVKTTEEASVEAPADKTVEVKTEVKSDKK